MGIVKVAMIFSMFRKILFLGLVFLIPIFVDVASVYYPEPISDIIGAIFTGTF